MKISKLVIKNYKVKKNWWKLNLNTEFLWKLSNSNVTNELIPDVREVLREKTFLSIFFVHYLSKYNVFIQRVLLQIHFYSYKDKKCEIIY